MNIENIDKAIAVMTRVKDRGDNINMDAWQENFDDHFCATEDELHSCGTAACFAGWVAVSPEFEDSGGSLNWDGSPRLGKFHDTEAIAAWLGIPSRDANALCWIADHFYIQEYMFCSADEVTADSVISVLSRLKETGSVFGENV